MLCYPLSTSVYQLGFVWKFTHNLEEFATYLFHFSPLLGYAYDYYPKERPWYDLHQYDQV